MKPLLLITVLLASLLWMPTVSAQSGSTTCDDFTYQEDAQAAWDDGEGRARADYMTGMDEDGDGKACEHLPGKPPFWQSIWFALGVLTLLIIAGAGLWWRGKVKAANADRATDYLFPGRTSTEEVEDELALLKADRAIDEADDSAQNR